MLGSVLPSRRQVATPCRVLNAVLRRPRATTTGCTRWNCAPRRRVSQVLPDGRGLDVRDRQFLSTPERTAWQRCCGDGPGRGDHNDALCESDPIVEIVRFIRQHSPETTIIGGRPLFPQPLQLPTASRAGVTARRHRRRHLCPRGTGRGDSGPAAPGVAGPARRRPREHPPTSSTARPCS